ncbi:hypothetical protein [Desertivirga brevis]|uniref:hypothetical protein n=1 Tax=Desertivirga brevis TaxID=2810310 RepID=UPI001A968E87|nr:hypothetical protein [Pedobacter sp. SYSU D00873]
MNMIIVGLYILYEGYLREVVSEVEDSFIIEIENEFLLVPKQAFPVYTLNDLSATG